MIALLQRAQRASVSVDGTSIAHIETGICTFVGVTATDDHSNAARLAKRVAAYRLFSDSAGRMNVNVVDAGGAVLAIPQFTLAADTSRGNRAGFGPTAEPAIANTLFDVFVAELNTRDAPVATGRFGADMQVELVNDGPVTFWIEG
ncbi:D-tyrosyl-tRNA(Tyr) deacylase [Salinisphaera sp. USBA-960]|uniref:D-aminoacyl-tRNA deacylase n=1 Tax=Salinisphaera orenii TaxID=856731 RepID=UPI000DBE2ED4|nr:D-tyrosyl-tRNA(Tyr) deacylase [Salifodinibacter halophilus]NNC25486.1 D-tyrosyl-tRNA(Tyr) deacylase [Salifodinibacter halophilus]